MKRMTRHDLNALRAAVLAAAANLRGDGAGFTLWQLFYRCTVLGLIDKTEAEYKRLSRITAEMRREGAMPFDWMVDSTRTTRQPPVFENAADALRCLANQYHESPWVGAEEAPEVWLEKEALAGVVVDATFERYVPLRTMRGYASLTALDEAVTDACTRAKQGTVTVVYQLGDFDPSGQDAMRAAREFVTFRAPGLFRFEQLGLTLDQVKQWRLPTRPTKLTDSRASKHGAISVELDALSPEQLVGLVSQAIDRHLPEPARLAHEAQTETTRIYLRALADASNDNDYDDDDDDDDEEVPA